MSWRSLARAVTFGTLLAAGVPGASARPDLPEPPEVAGHQHSGHHVDTIEHAKAWSKAAEGMALGPTVVGAWCGEYTSADNRANEVAMNGPKFHAIVAVPADIAAEVGYQTLGRQRMADDMFHTIETVRAFFATRTGNTRVGQIPYGWPLRFDYGTTCGPAYPDISFVELPRTMNGYLNSDIPYYTIIGDLLATGQFSRPNTRYLVHVYGDHPTACGESLIGSTDGSGGIFSLVYNPFSDIGGSWSGGTLPSICDWTTDAHEIGHAIGAATGGPEVHDGAHVWDCYNDVMSYQTVVNDLCGDGHLYFDYNNANYFAHGGGWNDTRRSPYWCQVLC